MANEPTNPEHSVRPFPTVEKDEGNEFRAVMSDDMDLKRLVGMKTHEAASGVYTSAIMALGNSAEKYANFVSANFAEIEPRDAIEAMLVTQMSATHVAMTTLCERMTYQTHSDVRESLERSTTRLSRTYLAQMEALKKHCAKAQQTVRVERVTVNEGGKAIVGDVTRHGGRPDHEK